MISGLKNILGNEKWIRVQFRGESPLITNPKICIPYQDNLFVLNPAYNSSFACRIILSISDILNMRILIFVKILTKPREKNKVS